MKFFKKASYAVFFIGSIVLLAFPFIAFLLDRSSETIENKSLQETPALIEADGSVNIDYLSDMGSYFSERFPLRSVLISLDAAFNEALFGESGIDNVVCGRDGWLYFAETVDDFMGLDQLDDGGTAALAYDLAYLNDYVRAKTDARVVFTIAPNKNSVYPSYMPWRYLRSDHASVAQVIQGMLESTGVNYVDLVDLYSDVPQVDTGSEPFLYYQHDSHWTNYGALPAYEALMSAADWPYKKYGLEDVEWGDRHGDLEDMLHPGTARTYYVPIGLWTDSECVDSVMNNGWTQIEEYESPAEGNFVMIGDSFRENLRQPLASNFRKSMIYQYEFIYDLEEILSPDIDVVMFERVERNLEGMLDGLTFPAEEIMSPEGLLQHPMEEGSISIEPCGSYYKITGLVEGSQTLPEDVLEGYMGVELTFADGSKGAYKALRSVTNEQGSFFTYVDGDIYEKGITAVDGFVVDGQGQVIAATHCML